MKKLLSILGAVSLTALASTTVVACGQQTEAKTPETLNNKTFNVNLDSLIETASTQINREGQGQWGDQTIGFLYSTLWSINQHNGQYPIQNEEVAAYLTQGEALTRGTDDGSNVTINGQAISELIGDKEDWHTIVLNQDDIVVFNVDINSYHGAEVIKTTHAEITINLK